MLCPKCGAYSPYNTAVCNRCGTNLLGKKAGRSPRRSKSGRYYRRIRQSDWEKNRDRLLARANDTLDDIMSDDGKRKKLFLALAASVLVLLLGITGCVSCACGGCGSCGSCADHPVSSGDTTQDVPPSLPTLSASDSLPDSDAIFGGESAETSSADTSPSDTSGHFGMDWLFGDGDEPAPSSSGSDA